MPNYRTAMGKNVDMTALIAKNEKVRAVGNMPVNARGDTIDANGKIIVPVTQKVGDSYQKTVGNRSAQVRPKQVVKQHLTKEEQELEDAFELDTEVEKIKAKEKKKR
ncbi:MAG: hypothetical protein EB127_15720 [Alphaproteobacteria bacterium]|nr:hypothetical protein [Alphaproteobacteria bacterium]